MSSNASSRLPASRVRSLPLPTPALLLRQQEEDLEPFPLNRHMWNHTPPIEGFGQDKVQAAAGAKRMGTKHR